MKEKKPGPKEATQQHGRESQKDGLENRQHGRKTQERSCNLGEKNGNVINENLGELDEIYRGKHHQLTQAGSRMTIRNEAHS